MCNHIFNTLDNFYIFITCLINQLTRFLTRYDLKPALLAFFKIIERDLSEALKVKGNLMDISSILKNTITVRQSLLVDRTEQ